MLTQRRKCCLVKIAHCMNLKGRTWEPDERVCDGTTGSGDDAEPLVILSDDEPLPLELFCFTPDGVVPTDSSPPMQLPQNPADNFCRRYGSCRVAALIEMPGAATPAE